jgi:hypothetical protein
MDGYFPGKTQKILAQLQLWYYNNLVLLGDEKADP